MKQTLVCKHCSVTTEQTSKFKVLFDKKRVASNKKMRLEEEKKRAENEVKKGLYEKRLKELKDQKKAEVESHRTYSNKGFLGMSSSCVSRSDEQLEEYISIHDFDLYYDVYRDPFRLEKQAARETSYYPYYGAFTFGPITQPENYILCPCCKERNYF